MEGLRPPYIGAALHARGDIGFGGLGREYYIEGSFAYVFTGLVFAGKEGGNIMGQDLINILG